jgi:hypothetical protein
MLIRDVLPLDLFVTLVTEVNEIAKELFPTRAWLTLRVTCECARRAGESTSLGNHSLSLALLCLRELSGDDDQAQVYHEKRSDL